MVTIAVKSRGSALQFADPTLKSDPLIVATALQSDSDAWKHADESLWTDRDAMLDAVIVNGLLLRYASLELRADPELVFSTSSERSFFYAFSDMLNKLTTSDGRFG